MTNTGDLPETFLLVGAGLGWLLRCASLEAACCPGLRGCHATSAHASSRPLVPTHSSTHPPTHP